MLQCMATIKQKMLTVKVAAPVLQDFKIAAELKGGTMSAIVHMFVVHTIREQKERNPEAFEKARKTSRTSRPLVRLKGDKGKAKKRKRGNGSDQENGE